MRITNADKVIASLRLKRLAGEKAVEKMIDQMAKTTLELSQTYVPVDTGALKASAQGGPIYSGTGITRTAVIEYVAPYVVYVHENLDSWHAPPTSAKFLERAYLELHNDGTYRRIILQITKEML